MSRRLRGKTNFAFLSRWTKRRRVVNDTEFAEWEDANCSDSSGSLNKDDNVGKPSSSSESRSDSDRHTPGNSLKSASECSNAEFVSPIWSEETEDDVEDIPFDNIVSAPCDEYVDSEVFNDLDNIDRPNVMSPEKETLKFLQNWAVDHRVPLATVDALLLGLRKHSCFANLPKSGRTIVHTPRSIPKTLVDPGEYIHIGLEVQLKRLLLTCPVDSVLCRGISLLVNIDGLPPFKSSIGEFYPILVSILNIPYLKQEVIPVGVYYGSEKPKSISDFLMPFISETKYLIENGIKIHNNTLTFSISGFCCDAPAKSYIMGIIGHGGFKSCTRCNVKGKTLEGKRVFLDLNCDKRTHEGFLNRVDSHYQPGETPLTLIPNIDFTSSFVLDYMHLVCLGVMRTLVFIWNSGTKSSKTSRLSKNSRDIVSVRLLNLKPHIPKEFARKPRELKLVLRWKATEFRSFLLYFGPIAMKGILDEQKYSNFLYLHIAMTILLNPVLCCNAQFRTKARILLRHFVEVVKVVYGEHLITHNFHGLIHLVDDADHFVEKVSNFSLNDISAFLFENFLQKLKGMLRGRNKPLEQVGRRLAEQFELKSNQNSKANSSPYFPDSSSHDNGPLLALCTNPQYHTVIYKDFKISTLAADQFCGTMKGDIIKVYNIAYSSEMQSMVVVGKKFIDKKMFYKVPLTPNSEHISSSDLGIFKVKKLSSWDKWPVGSIVQKYVCLPHKNYFVVFPMLHTYKS